MNRDQRNQNDQRRERDQQMFPGITPTPGQPGMGTPPMTPPSGSPQRRPGMGMPPVTPPPGPPSGRPGMGTPPMTPPQGFPPGQPGMRTPPTTPPPNFTPQAPSEMERRGMEGRPEAGAPFGFGPPFRPERFPRFRDLRRCLNRFVFIWLINGNSFWFFPTFIDRQFVYGFRWRRNRWEFDRINLNRIIFFRCF